MLTLLTSFSWPENCIKTASLCYPLLKQVLFAVLWIIFSCIVSCSMFPAIYKFFVVNVFMPLFVVVTLLSYQIEIFRTMWYISCCCFCCACCVEICLFLVYMTKWLRKYCRMDGGCCDCLLVNCSNYAFGMIRFVTLYPLQFSSWTLCHVIYKCQFLSNKQDTENLRIYTYESWKFSFLLEEKCVFLQ